MKNHYILLSTLFFWISTTISLSKVAAAPKISEVEYSDFLPKYRTASENFILSKIDYTLESTIVFFRYVAIKDNDDIIFYGSATPNGWKMTSSSNGQANAAYSVTRAATVQNIRINDEFKLELLDANSSKKFTAQKGDIITCEIHFEMMPRTVRAVHLLGGDLDNNQNLRFNCNDIQLKSKDSDLLGTKEQMDAVINRFYQKQPYVNYPDIKTVTTIAEQKTIIDKKNSAPKNPLQEALEPIDYMPNSLNAIEDLQCNERVILNNIYFHDNKSDFAGRVKALKTINLIVDYMNFYPKSKIVLHGHTDIFGNSFANLDLSKKRVETVKQAIISKGIDVGRVITVHHGGAQPLIQYKEGGEMNRRVEAEVLCGESTKKTTSDISINK